MLMAGRSRTFIKSSLLRYSIYLGAVTYCVIATSIAMDSSLDACCRGIPRGGEDARSASSFHPDLSDYSRRNFRWYSREYLDGCGNFNHRRGLAFHPYGLGAARNLAPHWVYLFCRGIIAVSKNISGGNPCNFCCKVLRVWPICGIYCLSNRHYWL